jgi:hypothetical protein
MRPVNLLAGPAGKVECPRTAAGVRPAPPDGSRGTVELGQVLAALSHRIRGSSEPSAARRIAHQDSASVPPDRDLRVGRLFGELAMARHHVVGGAERSR